MEYLYYISFVLFNSIHYFLRDDLLLRTCWKFYINKSQIQMTLKLWNHECEQLSSEWLLDFTVELCHEFRKNLWYVSMYSDFMKYIYFNGR